MVYFSPSRPRLRVSLLVVGSLPSAATLRSGSWSTRGALAFELVVPFSGATHLFSGKLPAFGVASKILAMKFLDPDTESAVRDFLARIPADIRLDRAILFGSRARGEHRPDSDADVALILHERGDDGMTLMMLAELAYYAYLDTGIMVQPVPIAIEDWLNPAAFPRPGFLRNVAREGIVL